MVSMPDNVEYDRDDNVAVNHQNEGQKVPIYFPQVQLSQYNNFFIIILLIQGQNQQVPWEFGEKVESGRLSGQRMSQNSGETTTVPLYIPQQRIVHLDLKGAPPSITYLKKVLTMSKGLGATGVLVEWEDMFPWSGR